MKFRSAVFGLLVVALFTFACAERSVTGVDGWSTVSGQVTLASGQGDVAGIEVSAEGTGQAVQTDRNGRFQIQGVPSEVTLVFRRGKEINDRIEVSAGSNLKLVVGNGGSRGRGRGVGHPGVEIEATIVSVSATELVVRNSRGETFTVVINEQTVIRHGNLVLTTADLSPNDRVHVKAKKDGEKLIAVEIKLQNDEEDDDESSKVEIEGIVAAVSPTSITVLNNRGSQTAAIVATTVIRHGHRTLTAADIKPGDRVHVKAQRAADGTLVATEIKVQNEADDDDDHSTKVEIEGTVSAISPASITVLNSKGSQTAAIVATTVIRHGNRTLTATDIKTGDRVHVKAQRAADGTLVATEIMVQNPADSDDDDDHSASVEIEGTVAAISATSITVRNNQGSQTAAIVASTVIRKGNRNLTVADVPLGSRVHVKAERGTGGALVAKEIKVQNS